MRYDVLTAMRISVLVFWLVTPRGLVGRHQRFGEHAVSIWAKYGDSHLTLQLDICWVAVYSAGH